jgi:glycosyltransferase involved in cell wall biosynthesis
LILGTAISPRVWAEAERCAAFRRDPEIVICVPQVETWKFRQCPFKVIALGESDLPCDSEQLRDLIVALSPGEILLPFGIPRCSPASAARLVRSLPRGPFVVGRGSLRLSQRPLVLAALLLANLVMWMPLRAIDAVCSQIDGLGVLLGGLVARCRRRRRPPRDGNGVICHVLPSLGTGGTQRQVVEYFKHAGPGSPLSLIVLFDQGDRFLLELEAAGIHVEILSRRCRGTLFGRVAIRLFPETTAIFALARILLSVRPASVTSWLFRANVVAVPAARIARVPLVVSSVRNLSTWKSWPEYRKWWYRAADRTAAALSDSVFANSRAAARDYCRWLDRESVVVDVIENGIDFEALIDAPRVDVRAQLQLPQSAKIVLTVGRLSVEKDHRTLIRALKLVSPQCPSWHLIIVGHGRMELELREYVQQCGIAEQVDFVGRVDDPQSYFSVADLFVLPSRIEGMPNALIEAQCFAVASITTDWPGASEFVNHGETAFVVSIGDAHHLAAEIERLLVDEGLRERIGGAAAATVRARADIHAMVKAIDRVSGRITD